ncbi:MAG: Smr/MutS family protein [Chloroflexi bacterium]|nr:Smr/MutS family protein [Chloroflexota bacterium]
MTEAYPKSDKTREASSPHGSAPFGPRSAESLLEFDRVRELLAGFTRFSTSREMALSTRPRWDYNEIIWLQDETAEARLLLDTVGDVGLGGLEDPSDLIQRAVLGGVLNGRELNAAVVALAAVEGAAAVVRSLGSQLPYLLGVVDDIGDFSNVRVEIGRAIEDGGEIRDSASPSLRKLRQGVAGSYNRLLQRLERISHSMDVQPSLQSDAIAVRGDRLVLEVRSERRKTVPGIVHDVSNTGQTIFIEPMEVVDLGNTWRETAAEVVREENRILRRLAEHLGDVGREALDAMKATAKLDMIMARGRLATSMTAARVECLLPTEVTAVELKDARHPLLGTDAVPATISVGPDFRCLVITGPNAGGKTVALKTVGLLALMNQAGLQIPASVDSRIAAFESIHADIGDAQSIERSVSTFSSHMSAVVDILNHATSRSLVLLDELGTGTDPEEGAALARAIVEELSQRRIPSVITTHHRGVAEFATQHDGTENASMELAPDTMLPTYHLAMGLPGRSYAIAVADQLGLPESVLERARGLVGSDHANTEDLLQQIQSDRKRLADLAAEAESSRNDAATAKRAVEVELAELRRRQEDMAEETRVALRREADEMRNTFRRIERDARREGFEESARKAAEEARRVVRDPDWLRAKLPQPEVNIPDEPEIEVIPEPVVVTEAAQLAPGELVELRGLGATAEVVAVLNDGETVELLIGGATARINMSEVRRLNAVKAAPEEPAKVVVQRTVRQSADIADGPTSELDLRGRRAHEIHEAVMEWIDQQILEGSSGGRVIHGKGTGALRSAVRETLTRHDAVEAFYVGSPAEGGDGVTMVELK